jgi:hypothetical protein
MSDVTRNGAAPDLLRHLAENTVHAPEPPGTGRYHFVHTASSYLRTVHKVSKKAGTRMTTGNIEHQERQLWVAPDGSGRLLVTQNGESVQPSGEFPPGRLAADFVVTAAEPLDFAAELRKRNPVDSPSAAMHTFSQIWSNQVVPPAVQRLLLLDLADHPDLTVEAAPRELADQPGTAIAHLDTERRMRHLLVFDSETGALTGAEVTALDGAKVPISTPAIVSSTKWLFSGYSATTGAPPRPAGPGAQAG